MDRATGTTEQFEWARSLMIVWWNVRDVVLARKWFKEAEARGFVVLYEKEQAF